jgi:ABC-type transport system involved in cytochrome bd biosynthesis fused ATPase/permease subunit
MFETSSPKVRKQILGLITNRFGISSLAILSVQQAMEALPTLWIVLVIQSITQGKPFFFYLILFLLTHVCYYIPWCLAYIVRISWKQEALRSFIHAFISSNRNNITDWNNKSVKEEKLSILTAEAPTAINALIDYIFDLYSYVASVVFNIMALSIVVEPLFAIVYSLSLTCVIILMNLMRRTQRQFTKKALSARVDLTQSLLAAWDNVLLGNNYNFNLWQEKTTQRLNRSLKKNIALERFDQLMAIITSLLTIIPSVIVVLYVAWTNQHDMVRLSTFIVTLPMLFTILSYTYQTLSLCFRWGMHKSKLASLFKTIQTSSKLAETMTKKVKWEKIRLMEETKSPFHFNSYHELMLRAEQSGRLTLRGENGSGKSTLLILIKAALQNKAFFLPTHSDLNFTAETHNHSTGESLRSRLTEILEKVSSDVLLLDEWDANLDQDNREKLSSLIDEIATRKCVIEVVHR